MEDACFDTVHRIVLDLLGTTVQDDAPLLSVGLDSLSATELVSKLNGAISTNVEPTVLFDHPTVGTLGQFID